jgi:hypothetical protein
MQVLHLGYDLHLKRPKPHMHYFKVTLNVNIAYKVGLFQSDLACEYCVQG